MFPSSDSFVCSPLPSNGSRGRHNLRGPVVPHLHRYYGLIRSLPVRRSPSLVALDHELPRSSRRDGEVFPSSWKIPMKACPGLETPAAPLNLAISVHRTRPSTEFKSLG